MSDSYRTAGVILAFPDAQEKVAELLDKIVTWQMGDAPSQKKTSDELESLRDDNYRRSDRMSRDKERIESLRAEIERLREALKHSNLALNDWLVTYSYDMQNEDTLGETWTRIHRSGSVMGYILDTEKRNRKALVPL